METKTEPKTYSKFKYDMIKNLPVEEHTLELTDQMIDRLKFNTGQVTTKASRKVIKYGVEQFSLKSENPHQIGYCMTELSNCIYKNVAIDEMVIHLYYLRAWRYFFRLIGSHRHHVSDLYKLVLVGNKDVFDVFVRDLKKVHSHKEFINFIWTIRATLDIDEMFSLNHCSRYWKNHSSRIIPKSKQNEWDLYIS